MQQDFPSYGAAKMISSITRQERTLFLARIHYGTIFLTRFSIEGNFLSGKDPSGQCTVSPLRPPRLISVMVIDNHKSRRTILPGTVPSPPPNPMELGSHIRLPCPGIITIHTMQSVRSHSSNKSGLSLFVCILSETCKWPAVYF